MALIWKEVGITFKTCEIDNYKNFPDLFLKTNSLVKICVRVFRGCVYLPE